jgi:transglutaminase-like putative cysteine protease
VWGQPATRAREREATVLWTRKFVPLRPSRYAEADKFFGFAATEFAQYADSATLLERVSSWVGTRLDYVPGSSDPIDGAADTLLAGAGVCRDYAHLVIALLRALNMPARLAAVYAPGCEPMDFHAVAEAFVDGEWRVVDATCLAPGSRWCGSQPAVTPPIPHSWITTRARSG